MGHGNSLGWERAGFVFPAEQPKLHDVLDLEIYLSPAVIARQPVS